MVSILWIRRIRIKEGIEASEVAKKFIDFYKANGYEKNYLYGPCHGAG